MWFKPNAGYYTDKEQLEIDFRRLTIYSKTWMNELAWTYIVIYVILKCIVGSYVGYIVFLHVLLITDQELWLPMSQKSK